MILIDCDSHIQLIHLLITMSDELPPTCPRCGSRAVEVDQQSEYTGGGYSDYWYEYYCNNCEFEWRSEVRSDYM